MGPDETAPHGRPTYASPRLLRLSQPTESLAACGSSGSTAVACSPSGGVASGNCSVSGSGAVGYCTTGFSPGVV